MRLYTRGFAHFPDGTCHAHYSTVGVPNNCTDEMAAEVLETIRKAYMAKSVGCVSCEVEFVSEKEMEGPLALQAMLAEEEN